MEYADFKKDDLIQHFSKRSGLHTILDGCARKKDYKGRTRLAYIT